MPPLTARALDATTGDATSWNPGANGLVLTLALNGPTLYVGGSFTSIGGQSRNHIAPLSTAAGPVSEWSPDAGREVRALAMNGSAVLAGGDFATFGGRTRQSLAVLEP